MRATTPLRTPALRAVRDSVVQMVSRGEIPSMAIAVSVNGVLLWEEAIGWADKESGRAADPRQSYRLGSLSKSLAATGVMTLVASGRLSLDQPVAPLLPFPLVGAGGDPTRATVRHVLNMSAGIPHGWFSFTRWEDAERGSPARARAHASIGQIMFEPGTAHEYSNFSAGLAEFITESISGRSYAVFMRESLFAPLGMDSTWTSTESDFKRHVVTPYDSRGTRIDSLGWFVLAGGGGFASSAHDLLRFAEFNLGLGRTARAPLPVELLDTMRQYADGPGSGYALGWFRQTDRVVSNGNIGGAQANLTLAPRAGSAAVCLMNATSPTNAPTGSAGRSSRRSTPVRQRARGGRGVSTWRSGNPRTVRRRCWRALGMVRSPRRAVRCASG